MILLLSRLAVAGVLRGSGECGGRGHHDRGGDECAYHGELRDAVCHPATFLCCNNDITDHTVAG
jgi:hypothetical protein